MHRVGQYTEIILLSLVLEIQQKRKREQQFSQPVTTPSGQDRLVQLTVTAGGPRLTVNSTHSSRTVELVACGIKSIRVSITNVSLFLLLLPHFSNRVERVGTCANARGVHP